MYESYFTESIQSEKELEKLTDYILRELSYARFYDAKNEKDKKSVFYAFSNKTNYKNKFLNSFISNLIERGLRVYFIDSEFAKEVVSTGEYDKQYDTIRVYTFFDTIEDVKGKTSKYFLDFYSKYKTAILHELTHVYDDFITKGKYRSLNYTGDGSDEYYKQNIEVNAFYSMVLPKIEVYRIYEFEKYLEQFKKEFPKFMVLDKDQQKRLIERLYKRWEMPITEDKQELLNSTLTLVLHSINDGASYKKSIDKRYPFSEKDVILYAKKIIQRILSGKIDRKLAKSTSSYENPYLFFNSIKSSLNYLDTLYSEYEEAKEDLDEKTEKLFIKMVAEEEKKFKTFKRFFKLSDKDFKKLAVNLTDALSESTKNKLQEMPYIDYGKNNIFDLEVEQFSSPRELIQIIKDILSGDEIEDKYGNVIWLKNSKDKQSFIIGLKDNFVLHNYIQNKMSDKEIQILNKLIGDDIMKENIYESFFESVEVYESYFDEEEDNFDEKIVKKYRVKDGKKVKSFTTDKDGYRIDMSSGRPKEIKVTGAEARKKSKSAKKGAKKAKPKQATSKRKAQKSKNKRTWDR